MSSALMLFLSFWTVTTFVVHPARATSVPAVNLDANSTSRSDVSVTTSASQGKSFRIGAVVNASETSPVKDVYGWQFGIEYNASAFLPQGDPGGSPYYPDGAQNTVLFGAQVTLGTVNWNAYVSAYSAYGGFQVGTESESCKPSGVILVFLTLINPTAPVTISAQTLLASVSFELIDRPVTPQYFRITDVGFSSKSGGPIAGAPVAGLGVTETVTNVPPHARFTVNPVTSGGPFAFTFNATESYDSDNSIPNPNGYFWDFGDGTQDLGITGGIVTHDYGADGIYVASLRVQDSAGATGAARDYSGNAIVNSQPSHANLQVGQVQTAGSFASLTSNSAVASPFTFYPSLPTIGDIMLFTVNGPRSDAYCWDFGDGTTGANSPTWHAYNRPGNFTATLTSVNGLFVANSSEVIQIRAPNPALPHLVWTELFGVPRDCERNDCLASSVSAGTNGVYTTNGKNVAGYDLNGNLSWTAVFGNALGDIALGVAAGSDAVYVVGRQGSSASRALLERYDLKGNLVWARSFLGNIAGRAWASAVSVDSTGIYVAGGTNLNYSFVARFDFNGNQRWMTDIPNTQCNTLTQCETFQGASSIAVGPAGVYVVGYTSCIVQGSGCPVGSIYWTLNAYIEALNLGGKELWTRSLPSGTTDGNVAVGRGGIYVDDAYTALVKYDFEGNVVWTRDFDFPIDVAANQDGVYVLGIHAPYFWVCSVDDFQCRFNSWHTTLTFLDSSGSNIWALSFPGDSYHEATAISTSPSGVFVAGSTFISRASPPLDCNPIPSRCDPHSFLR